MKSLYNSSPRMPEPVTCSLLRGLKPGQTFVYYVGHFESDIARSQTQVPNYSRVLTKVQTCARNLATAGRVTLSQERLILEPTVERVGAEATRYIATGAGKCQSCATAFPKDKDPEKTPHIITEEWSESQLSALEMKIENLDLPVRARNGLLKADVNRVADLVELTETDLARLPNFGRGSISDVVRVLAKLDLELGMTVPDRFLGEPN